MNVEQSPGLKRDHLPIFIVTRNFDDIHRPIARVQSKILVALTFEGMQQTAQSKFLIEDFEYRLKRVAWGCKSQVTG